METDSSNEKRENVGILAQLRCDATQAGDVVVWDYRQQKFIREVKLTKSPCYLWLSPDGKHLAAGSEQGAIWIWDMACNDEKPKYTLQGHSKHFTSIAFHPSGKQLASAGDDNAVILWDLTTQQPVVKNTSPAMGFLGCCLFLRW